MIKIFMTQKTLTIAISHANSNRNKPIKQAVCDRGYVGAKVVLGANIILPKKALKRDNRYQRDKKRKLCKRRAAIEPIIRHLKSDFRLSRNLLKGQVGDEINVFNGCLCLEFEKMAGNSHYFFVLAKTGFIFL
ncbi:hypothetical protein BSPWISOXPB_4634 [uncultured Gammaproteobacteria bacterium]|nr:hypothetical protein BSPWISOXPB_4634 [uncultured Gammaproteobacteria bacterium]